MSNLNKKYTKLEKLVLKGNLYMKEIFENKDRSIEEIEPPLIVSGRNQQNSNAGLVNAEIQNTGSSFLPNKSVYSPNSFSKPNTAVQFRNLSNRMNLRNRNKDFEGLRSTRYAKITAKSKANAVSSPNSGLKSKPLNTKLEFLQI